MNKQEKFKLLADYLHDRKVLLVTMDLFDAAMEGHIMAEQNNELVFTSTVGDSLMSLRFSVKDVYIIKIFSEIIEVTLLRLRNPGIEEEDE